jgi:hypothetical protein
MSRACIVADTDQVGATLRDPVACVAGRNGLGAPAHVTNKLVPCPATGDVEQ